MKRLLFIFLLVSLLGSLVLCPVYAQNQSVNVVLEQLRSDLLNSKVPIKDVNSITQVLKKLLNQGAVRGDLRGIVLNITKKGIAGKDLNIFLESVSTLVESGAKVSEAGNVVLQAIDQGLAYGFKGGDLGLVAKVKEAVKQKKTQLFDEAKKKAQEEGVSQTDDSLGPLTNAMNK
ncbi:MAG: hypothetical protein PHC37_06895 [Candidatus Omnitrophica bacterium]|nr:hypothetical protein [Candidatus Omnitrophota bacterium]